VPGVEGNWGNAGDKRADRYAAGPQHRRHRTVNMPLLHGMYIAAAFCASRVCPRLISCARSLPGGVWAHAPPHISCPGTCMGRTAAAPHVRDRGIGGEEHCGIIDEYTWLLSPMKTATAHACLIALQVAVQDRMHCCRSCHPCSCHMHLRFAHM
jgi:hypothetical protein